VHELFAIAGDIRVSDSELNITLAPLGSPHRTHAAQALCVILEQTATIFPGFSPRAQTWFARCESPLALGLMGVQRGELNLDAMSRPMRIASDTLEKLLAGRRAAIRDLGG
jgi:hypothetical protein